MLLAPSRFALRLVAAASLAATSIAAPAFASAASTPGAGVSGPPRITVRELPSPTPGGKLVVEGEHHNQASTLNIIGRAEGVRDGKRVSLPLRLVRTGAGKYSIAKQWQTGSPWLLVLTAEDGPNGSHAVAEAFVKIDATGKVSGIEYPAPGWMEKTNTPRRTSARDIDAILAGMAASLHAP